MPPGRKSTSRLAELQPLVNVSLLSLAGSVYERGSPTQKVEVVGSEEAVAAGWVLGS